MDESSSLIKTENYLEWVAGWCGEQVQFPPTTSTHDAEVLRLTSDLPVQWDKTTSLL